MRRGDGTIVIDEMAIKVGETKKSLELFNSSWCWRGLDSIQLPLVHFDTIGTDVISEELDGGKMEGTFLRFKIQLVLAELLEDLSNVLAMFSLIPGVH